jgi:hypothetical protein
MQKADVRRRSSNSVDRNTNFIRKLYSYMIYRLPHPNIYMVLAHKLPITLGIILLH